MRTNRKKNISLLALQSICEQLNQDFEQHNSFIAGRRCFRRQCWRVQMMGFFQESDILFLEEMLVCNSGDLPNNDL